MWPWSKLGKKRSHEILLFLPREFYDCLFSVLQLPPHIYRSLMDLRVGYVRRALIHLKQMHEFRNRWKRRDPQALDCLADYSYYLRHKVPFRFRSSFGPSNLIQPRLLWAPEYAFLMEGWKSIVDEINGENVFPCVGICGSKRCDDPLFKQRSKPHKYCSPLCAKKERNRAYYEKTRSS